MLHVTRFIEATRLRWNSLFHSLLTSCVFLLMLTCRAYRCHLLRNTHTLQKYEYSVMNWWRMMMTHRRFDSGCLKLKPLGCDSPIPVCGMSETSWSSTRGLLSVGQETLCVVPRRSYGRRQQLTSPDELVMRVTTRRWDISVLSQILWLRWYGDVSTNHIIITV